jgi:CelD/BcsL family acetyltransferase involved in cellulose biosynthesis
MRVRIAHSIEELSDRWPTAAGLSRVRGFPFQARDYLAVWLSTIGAARRVEPLLVEVEDDTGNTLMFVPIGIERRNGARILAFLDGGVVDYNAPLLCDGVKTVDWDRLWRALVEALPPFDAAILEKMPPDVRGAENPFAHAAGAAPSTTAYRLGLLGTWREFAHDRLPRAQDSRRKRRRLDEQGGLSFVVASDADVAEKILQAMIIQKTRRYLDTRGTDSFKRPGYRDYFQKATEDLRARGLVHLAALYAGEQIVASHWGLVADDTFYYLMPAHADDQWARYSPGRLIIEDMIRWSYEQGLKVFDFGEGDEAFKTEFADETVSLLSLRVANSVVGHTFLALADARRALAKSFVGDIVRGAREMRLTKR